MAKAKGGLKTCEHCRSSMSLLADTCPHCGKRAKGGIFGTRNKVVTSTYVTPVKPPVPRIPDPTKPCPDCAETVKAEARICRFCRYEFAPDDESDAGRRPEK